MAVRYIDKDPKTGILSYRRIFPTDLRPFLPRRARELKRSLRARTFHEGRAAEIYRQAVADYDRMLADAQAKATGTKRPLQDADIPYLVDSYAFRILKDAELSHFDPDDSAFNLPWVPSLRYSPIALNALDDAGQEIPGSRRERVLSGLPVALQVWKEALGSGDRAKVIEIEAQAANELLDAANLAADPEGREYFALCYRLLAKDHEIYAAVLARFNGEIVPPPVEPEPLPDFAAPPKAEGPKAQQKQGMTMRDIADAVRASPREHVPLTTRQAWQTALRFWDEVYPKLSHEKTERAMVSAWLDLLSQRPVRLPPAQARLPLPKLVEKYEGRAEVQRISATTLAQHLGTLSTIWNRGVRRGDVDDKRPNPFANHDVRRNLPPSEGQQGLPMDVINAIFRLPVFTKGERPKRGKGEAVYWVPLFLLWTGARPNEIAQLIRSDFWQDDAGKWNMKITDEGVHPAKGPRSLKTSRHRSGIRQFPVPQALIDLGLPAYLKWLEDEGEEALFPKLRPKGNDLFAGFGEWWSLYTREHGVVPEGKRPSREFRHNFMSAARQSGIPAEAVEYIAGHVQVSAGTNARYGTREAWGLEMEKLRYEGLDLSGVRRWAAPADTSKKRGG
ncbi:site-specific integrase [Sphingobium herbicidovorans]|uniref:tyrosine-type recombinase/integrase n=1 Tax=Sphingobium herbicidovorans TaxID=76947 RepID=UPI00055A7186|nr:tyrosine-type recombinase/integrase [Sphingobium herbicidovorans]